jgi:hypothetical protein
MARSRANFTFTFACNFMEHSIPWETDNCSTVQYTCCLFLEPEYEERFDIHVVAYRMGDEKIK